MFRAILFWLKYIVISWYKNIEMHILHPGSWHRASKTLEIAWVVGVMWLSVVIHNKPLSILGKFMVKRWLAERGLVARGTNHVIRVFELSAPLSNLLGKVEELGIIKLTPILNDLINHPHIMDLKTLNEVVQSFQVGECIYVLEGWHTWTPQRQKLMHLNPSGLCPMYIPLHLVVHLYTL